MTAPRAGLGVFEGEGFRSSHRWNTETTAPRAVEKR